MSTVRIGIIGAGANTVSRHIPGLLAINDVKIVCLANRTVASGRRVADQFDIPRVHARWQDVIADDQVDAVCIGTWPYLHAPAACAALAAGKHVLCEARMAAAMPEARQMLAAAQQSDKVAMLVPSPFGLVGDQVMRDLLASGTLGQVRELYIRGFNTQLLDPAAPLHWRQRAELSGVNVLALGILNETVQRWFGRAQSVLAQASLFTPRRIAPETGLVQDVDVPDAITVLARQADGANAVYHLSGVAAHGGPMRVEAYGSAGTIVHDLAGDTIRFARTGQKELSPVAIPPEKAGGWRVEADFIDSIRQARPVVFTSFADGLKYMEFTAAARLSADTGRRVALCEV